MLLRNLYSETDEEGVTTTPPEAAAAALRMAGYVQAQLAHLRAIPTEEMLRARVSWAPGPSRDSCLHTAPALQGKRHV